MRKKKKFAQFNPVHVEFSDEDSMNQLPAFKNETQRAYTLDAVKRQRDAEEILSEHAKDICYDESGRCCSDAVFEKTKLAMDVYTSSVLYGQGVAYAAVVELFPEHADEPSGVFFSQKLSFFAKTKEEAWKGLEDVLRTQLCA